MSCGPRASGSLLGVDDARGPARRAVLAGALALPFAAHAQTTWPTKPIRIVVPFNPGGAIDALVGIIADRLTAKLGQQVLVDPKPGAAPSWAPRSSPRRHPMAIPS